MKAVIILRPDQPLGLLVNTASILSVTLGDTIEGIRGVDTMDASGVMHPGVIGIPLPILAAEEAVLDGLYRRALETEGLFVADFSRTAQSCKRYDEYLEKCAHTHTEEMGLLGLALYGERKKVNKLVGNLKGLR